MATPLKAEANLLLHFAYPNLRTAHYSNSYFLSSLKAICFSIKYELNGEKDEDHTMINDSLKLVRE
jgi:hypothetical protein